MKAYKTLIKNYFPLEKIYMFGSYAHDTYRDDSDIDVAIVVKKMEGDFFSIRITQGPPLFYFINDKIKDHLQNSVHPAWKSSLRIN